MVTAGVLETGFLLAVELVFLEVVFLEDVFLLEAGASLDAGSFDGSDDASDEISVLVSTVLSVLVTFAVSVEDCPSVSLPQDAVANNIQMARQLAKILADRFIVFSSLFLPLFLKSGYSLLCYHHW